MATQARGRNRGNRQQQLQQQQHAPPPTQDPEHDYPFGRLEDAPQEDVIVAANLRVLRRHFPDIEEIVFRAHIANLYKLDTTEHKFSDNLASGPTFVVSLARTDLDIPRYAVVLLSRKQLSTAYIELKLDDDVETFVDGVLVRNCDTGDVWCFEIHRGPSPESAMRDDPERAQEAIAEALKKIEEGKKAAEAKQAAMSSAPQSQWDAPAGPPLSVQHVHAFQQQGEQGTPSGMQHPYDPYGYPPPAAPSPYPPPQSQPPQSQPPQSFGHPPAFPAMQMHQQQAGYQPPLQPQAPNIDINQLFLSAQGQEYSGAR